MHTTVRHFVAASVALLGIAGMPTHAAPVITTFAEYSNGPVTDAGGPVTPLPGDPPLVSSVSTTDGASLCGITGSCVGAQSTQAHATASQRETVFGIFSDLSADATFYNGSDTVQSLTARTTWQESPAAAGPNSITLFIKPGELVISDFGGVGLAAPTIDVSYRIELTLNGAQVFFSEAILHGGVLGQTLTKNGTDLGSTAFADPDFPFNVHGYRFDPYTNRFAFANLTPADVVEYVMEAHVSGPGYETGGRALVGDPFDLTGDVPSIAFTGPVPEASTFAMLGVGLIALSFMARRKRRHSIRAPSRVSVINTAMPAIGSGRVRA